LQRGGDVLADLDGIPIHPNLHVAGLFAEPDAKQIRAHAERRAVIEGIRIAPAAVEGRSLRL
jgi:hypothetical protein